MLDNVSIADSIPMNDNIKKKQDLRDKINSKRTLASTIDTSFKNLKVV